MTEFEMPAGKASHGSRKPFLIILAAATVAIGATGAALLFVGGGHTVRYEIETTGGSTRMITWTTDNHGIAKAPESLDETIDTPWSTTVTFKAANQQASVATDVASGTASCRIFLDGRKVSESTSEHGVICEVIIP